MTNWKEKTLTHWDHINRLANRRFGRTVLAEEAALFVMEGLAEKDWQRVKSYSGRASFQTFLSSLSWRLLEDFARKRFGRVRPPLWIRKLGGIWPMLFDFLCLQRFPTREAVELVAERNMNQAKDVIETAAYNILEQIPDCAKEQGKELSLEEEKEQHSTSSTPTPEALLEGKEKDCFLSGLFNMVVESKDKKRAGQGLEAVFNHDFSLTAEERLLLKLCYQDNLPVTRAGKALGLNRHQTHGRLRRLLGRLRKDLKQLGVEEDLRLLLK